MQPGEMPVEILTQPDANRSAVSRDDAIALYRWMLVVREFENTVATWCQKQIVPGISQLCIGQEASAVGTIYPLRREDKILITYRGHGQSIVKGTPLVRLFAEILGRSGGCCQGKGGPMHLTDVAVGNLGENPIVGAHLSIACGVAYALKKKRTDLVCLCDFSEGAVQIGTFHEAVNLAAIWKLPVIFVCENNHYGISVPFHAVSPVPHVVDRASAYGIPGVLVDGNDVLAVLAATQRALERARSGNGPTLIECLTYRYCGHSQFDLQDGAAYRSKKEIDEWKKKEPIHSLKHILIERYRVPKEELADLEREAESEVAEAAQQALDSPLPDPSATFEGVFADGHDEVQ
jgi:TPP-dependent pyruvate/acetoin dehydrogenase alpha subunit